MNFTKMQGAGNDYIYVNCLEEEITDPVHLVREMSTRHFGIGADGLILVCPSQVADFRMRIFNPDGSEAEMCGNGIRCFAKYLYDKGLAREKRLKIETGAGVKQLELLLQKDEVVGARVDMGMPILERSEIPMRGPPGQVISESLKVGEETFTVTCVSLGNPHCIVFVSDVARAPVARVGALLESHQAFPRGTNVEFVEVESWDKLKVRVWERGVGETLACGTGASAAVVAAVLNNLTARKATVELPGGSLQVDWQQETLFLSGPAETVFEGEWLVC